MNKLQRLGRETETDRTCRVKMYKAGKNWLTSCQVCRYFLNRAVISVGAVAIGMTMTTHIAKADTVNPSADDNLTALNSTITHSEVSSVPAIEDNSMAVVSKATLTTPDQTADQIGMSTVSSAANSDSMANTAQTSAAQDNSKTISSNSSQSTTQSIAAVQSATVLENERAAEADLVSSRLKMQTAAPVLTNTNAIIEPVEPSPLAVDYQALTKDWQVDAKRNVTYIGKSTDLTTITVPNSYDFYQVGKIQAGQSVTIAASVIHNLLKQNRQLSELIISSDGDGKLIAKGNWTAAFSGYDVNYMNIYNSKIKSLDLGGLDV